MDFHTGQFPLSGNINMACIPHMQVPVVVGTLTSDENVVDDKKQRKC